MLRVGLTGGIATGKSHVRARFEARGVPAIDADRLARDVVATGTEGLAAVVARFGPAMVAADGALDRPRLASLVFADAEARRMLESIIHPRVYAAVEHWFETQPRSQAGLAIAEIPLLFETQHAGAFDAVVVAACRPELQLARLRERDGLTLEAARQRLAAQWPIDEKVRLADFVVRTDGTFADTDGQVAEVDAQLRSRAAREF